ncbi:MAG: cytochrome c biogenesis protein CcdA [Candidatus Hadarchaeum sp.]|uniref:cytochrome c biogenesis CcdA family protein n=1 Tax=Candidatus Hadarchaeum sp. TaxID=2883567 RepID=UPI003174E659
MLPAYVAYHFRRRGIISMRKSVAEGASVGAAVSFGFITVFLMTGTLVSLLGVQIGPYSPWAMIAVGEFLIALGLLWLAGVKLSLSVSLPAPLRGGLLSFFIFGVGYAIASTACALPVFLMVVFTAISSGELLSGLLIFLAYSLGMAVLMVPLTIAVSTSKNLILHRFERVIPQVRKIGWSNPDPRGSLSHLSSELDPFFN